MTGITESIETSITQVFTILPDPRKERGRRHQFFDVITVAIVATLCGCDDWLEVTAFGHAREEWFRQFLSLPNGIPSADTFRRIFRFLDHRPFERCFVRWTEQVCKLIRGRIVSIDGKLLRGTKEDSGSSQAICIVSAFAAETAMVLGQPATETKSNEITAIPLLLEMLDIEKAIVTIDAAGCQKAIAHTILERGGDYVLGLKGNQQTLHDEAQNLFSQALAANFEAVPVDHFHTEEKSGNRYGVRDAYVVGDLDWLPQTDDWCGLRSLVLIRSQRIVNRQTSLEDRYYISSLAGNAEQIACAIRSHWYVETKLHWVLGVAYRQDLCKTRKDNEAQNFSVLRRMTANLIRNHKAKNPKLKGGVKCRRKVASWSDSYLQELLECE